MDESGTRAAGPAYECISVEHRGRIALLRFCRPTKLNPLDWTTIKELRHAVAEVEANPAVAVAVITGSGRSFSAGGDLDGYLRLYQNPNDFLSFLNDFGLLLAEIEASRVIYVSALNGLCVAGGLELLLACDLVLASSEARIGDGHLNFGQLPGAGGSQRLPRAIGALRAKYLILTGSLIDAEEARSIGLVNTIFPPENFESDVLAFVEKLMSKSTAGLSGAKHLVNHTSRSTLEEGLRHELGFVHRYATSHPDAMEGLIAFRDKRKPDFT